MCINSNIMDNNKRQIPSSHQRNNKQLGYTYDVIFFAHLNKLSTDINYKKKYRVRRMEQIAMLCITKFYEMF